MIPLLLALASLTPPPSLSVMRDTPTSLKLQWSSPTEAECAATPTCQAETISWLVEKCVGACFSPATDPWALIGVTNPGATSFIATGLSAGATYSFRVRAWPYSATGFGTPSTSTSTTTTTTVTTTTHTTTTAATTSTTSTTTTTSAGSTTTLPLAAPFLGLVHESVCDSANAQPGFQQGWWSLQCNGACAIGGAPYSCSQYEIPLIRSAPAWNDTTTNITATMQSFFTQNPNIPIWQFGWEENIKSGCCTAPRLVTLDQQFAAIRQAQTNAGNAAKLSYQLVWSTTNPFDGTGTNLFNGSAPSIQAFFAPSSPAPNRLDYVALHPYLWNNWPNPDAWVPQMIGQLKSWIAASQNPAVGIIFTEGGATVCDSPTTGCTCDEFGTTVRAMGQSEHADYWLKSHVLALANGVHKIVWYQGATDPVCSTGVSCESNCFAITNNAGGRPTHTAYSTMTHCLGNATGVSRVATAAPFVSYDFKTPAGHCFVAWTYQAGTTQVVAPTLPSQSVAVTTLTGGHAATSVTDKLGNALSTSTITLTPSPVFVRTP
jgi:hypothetical protein